jgi:hypothetical protein
VLAVALLAAGSLLVASGGVVAWADATAHDPDTYADATVLELEEGGLTGLIEERVSTALMEWADLEGRIGEMLPAPLGLIGGPTEDLAEAALSESIATVLAEEPIAGQIADLEDAVDEELVTLLFAESDWFHLDGTTVVLDLDPLVQAVADRIDDSIPTLLTDLFPDLTVRSLIPDEIDGGGLELAVGEVPALTAALVELDDLTGAPQLALAGAVLLLLGVVVSRRRLDALAYAGVAVSIAALGALAVTWLAGGPLWPETGAIEAVAGQSLVDANGRALVVDMAVLVGLGALGAGAAVGIRAAVGSRAASTGR